MKIRLRNFAFLTELIRAPSKTIFGMLLRNKRTRIKSSIPR